MTHRGWIKTGFAAVVALMGLMVTASTAMADQQGDVAVLLTEVVEPGVVDDDQQIGFWWSSAGEPRWTGSDEMVFEALQQAGVTPRQPGTVDISRIYRRPDLSVDNAAQLGRLLGVDRVLVGEVVYSPVGPVPPLGHRGVQARADVTLVPSGNSDAVALDQFTVTRQVFEHPGEDGTIRVFEDRPGGLIDHAREVTGSALGEVMGQSFRRASGRVGVDSDQQLLALRDVQRAAHLETIREMLVGLDEVASVVKRWAAEGVIALEIEPADPRDDDAADYARRVLENHDFEDFDLTASSDGAVLDGVYELWLESREY